MRRAQIAAVLCASRILLTSAAEAQEPPLERARAAYGAGELDTAVTAFEEALRTPGHDPAELVEIHTHLGILRAMLGDDEAARRAFVRALALDPTLEAPSELSPELREAFEEARSIRRGRPLAIAVRSAPVGTGVRVSMRITDAPEGMVRSVGLEAAPPGGGAPWRERVALAPGAGVAVIDVPIAAWRGAPVLEGRMLAFDAHGNVVAASSGRLSSPVRSEGAASAGATSPETDGGSSTWVFVGIGAAVAAGVAVAVVLLASGGNDACDDAGCTFGAPQVRP